MTTQATIVILAAGLGTRMRSKTAKVLHEAGGFTLVEHVVRSALTVAPPDRVVVVTGHQAEKVESRLAGHGLRFARQTEQHGTGHALEMCRAAVPDHEGRLIVLYGDCPLLSAGTLALLLSHHKRSGAAATVITTDLPDPTGYGRCILDGNGDVRAIVEQKVATEEQRAVRTINSGIYCFEAPLLWDELKKIQPNPVSGEYYLTDIVEILNARGQRVSALQHPDASELLGINTRVDLAEVESVFQRRKATELMLGGVTLVRPDSVRIDADVTVGIDTIIEPFVQLLGRTVVGDNCRIGAGSILRDSSLANSVEIGPYTIVSSSVIDEGASVGPFARLRMENHVGVNCHIGNFVELKKTNLAPGVKAGHLAYLGDSDIGAGTNIGAGTITCNYDGAKKHRTTVGEQAFVGSNSTLVAPVEIGAGAYIAAGSVITQAVPEDALGIGRGRQTNKEDWAAKRRGAKVTLNPASADAQ
ncbi:MAG: bifunctional UDP-N-acetylglucosamine diphosphorylase/glucosamine-1-phosphate N-acetyltransferase GlmU [Bryobacteraceae bacterium]|nr:bifunctional UDP-N-acetylglucosamine diphosphorylase/glucosamine-1-phosphate N-acetyltransferase GlmU [Bryobacteraceae bacterium]